MVDRKKTPLIIIFVFFVSTVLLFIAYYSTNQIKNTSLVRKPSSQKTTKLEPSDFEEKANGCGNFIVYKYSKKAGGLSVKINNDTIQITNSPITLDIQSTNDVEIIYAEGENLFETMPTSFCNDYSNPKTAKPKVWTATSGTVTVSSLGSSEKSLSGFSEYYVRVDLENIYFLDESNKNPISLSKLVFEKVLVGWYPG